MNVYMPAEVVDSPQRRSRFLDWRFLAALAALLLVGFLVYAGFRNYEIREAEAAQKDALLSQLAERSDQIENLEGEVATLTGRIMALQDRARADRRTAGRERRQLLRQQERMLALLRAANVSYRPSGGFTTAAASYTPTTGGGSTSTAATSTASSTRAATSTGSTAGTTSQPRTTTPAPAPEPTAGKSGKTPPGKGKGIRR